MHEKEKMVLLPPLLGWQVFFTSPHALEFAAVSAFSVVAVFGVWLGNAVSEYSCWVQSESGISYWLCD